MRITILSQYYPPETGAPQNRLHSLARHLSAAGHDVRVVTSMPSYPKMQTFAGYRRRLFLKERLDGIPVHRAWSYVHGSRTFARRLFNYWTFVVTSVLAALASPRADYVFCESPPLFLGLSGILLSWSWGARLIFNVADLWPESAERLGLVRNGRVLRWSYALEGWIYRRSHLVTGQTQGIVQNIRRRFPETRVFWLPNGIDEDLDAQAERDPDWLRRLGVEGRRVLLYAGILGYAQGLDVIVRAARALSERKDLAFVVVGDGPERERLVELNRAESAGVRFLPAMPRPEVLRMVASAYACIVPLRKLDIFTGAIPSKVFEPLAAGVPVLLGVDGEARALFIDQGHCGVFFEPEDSQDLARGVLTLVENPTLRDSLGAAGSRFVRQRFRRRDIAARFIEQLEG